MRYYCIFFFQAEDGIRDYKVTGVQTCALPIYGRLRRVAGASGSVRVIGVHSMGPAAGARLLATAGSWPSRSEVRRVGKRCSYVRPTENSQTKEKIQSANRMPEIAESVDPVD